MTAYTATAGISFVVYNFSASYIECGSVNACTEYSSAIVGIVSGYSSPGHFKGTVAIYSATK